MNKLLLALTCLLLTGSFSSVRAQYVNPMPRMEDVRRQPIELKGATLSTEALAKDIADAAYWKLGCGWLANEASGVNGVVQLGFDMPGFAKQGDLIWEVRVVLMHTQLRALIWVHSETGKVKFLIAPVTPKADKTKPCT
ncbi:MAG TPA: hypothetical protein VER76_18440 [Pyrinomonadaceae bacterium]|nr:hypothetical protein [Pyrinomonadaceae bacterium]